MIGLAAKVVVAIALPTIVFLGGSRLMSQWAGRTPPQDPLNQRFGYSVRAVDDFWGRLGPAGRAAEARFLELDLVFPFLYGGALASGLLILWAILGRPFSPAWVLGPVILGVVADWTENLVQLAQLRRYVPGNPATLQGGWIAVASAATATKLSVLYVISGGLLLLAILVLVRHRGPKAP